MLRVETQNPKRKVAPQKTKEDRHDEEEKKKQAETPAKKARAAPKAVPQAKAVASSSEEFCLTGTLSSITITTSTSAAEGRETPAAGSDCDSKADDNIGEEDGDEGTEEGTSPLS